MRYAGFTAETPGRGGIAENFKIFLSAFSPRLSVSAVKALATDCGQQRCSKGLTVS
jgi:hypothetical protein